LLVVIFLVVSFTGTNSTVGQLVTHILALRLLAVTLGVQEVREEEQFDDDKEDKKLDADNQPQRFAHSHAAESIIIQVECTRPESLPIVLTVTHGERRIRVKQLTKLVTNFKFANN
jgi:hypothetical protein